MLIDIRKEELDFILSCISCDRDMGVASTMGFDTSYHNKMIEKLSVYGDGMETYSMPFLVEFTYDNGAIIEDMKAICLAFDEDDASKIIKSRFSRYSDDVVSVKIVRKFTDNDIISEKN